MLKQNVIFKKLAISHLHTLSEDFLPSLGLKYLTRFYQFIYSSSFEKVITHESATCVITYSADSLWRRVLINTFPAFIFAVLPKLLDLQFHRCLLSCKKYKSPSPQIAFMFSDEKGKGHGSELLSKLNLSPLYVKTLTGGRAEKFYKKNKFFNYF